MRRRTSYLVIAVCTVLGISATAWLSWPRVREEVFFLGIKMPLHESVKAMHEVLGDHRDPFALDHPLSQIKPDLTERPLPVSAPAQTQTIMVGQSEFSFPVIGDVRIFERGPLAAMVRSPGCTVAISQVNLDDTVFSLPLELQTKYAEMPFFAEVDGALRQLGNLSEFDQLIRILNADAQGLRRSVPLSERVTTVLLLSCKLLFAPLDPDIPVRYYQNPGMRCLLVGPEPYSSEAIQPPDVGEEAPEQPQAMISQDDVKFIAGGEHGQGFRVWLSSPKGGTLVELMFRYREPGDLSQIAANTLTFLGQCRVVD